ncbi:hypothetical protein GCM10022140_23450 [Rhodococcus aetherivorans]
MHRVGWPRSTPRRFRAPPPPSGRECRPAPRAHPTGSVSVTGGSAGRSGTDEIGRRIRRRYGGDRTDARGNRTSALGRAGTASALHRLCSATAARVLGSTA